MFVRNAKFYTSLNVIMEHLCNSTVKDCNRRCFSSNGIVGLANIGVFVSHLVTGYIIKVTVLFLLSM